MCWIKGNSYSLIDVDIDYSSVTQWDLKLNVSAWHTFMQVLYVLLNSNERKLIVSHTNFRFEMKSVDQKCQLSILNRWKFKYFFALGNEKNPTY